MNIALDAMGGDHAPKEIVKGALQAAPRLRHNVILVGDPVRIQALLPKPCPTNIEIHPASEVVEMHESPTEALRRKKDSSLWVGAELVRTGAASAFVSAGNTGAATAACFQSWRRIRGFHRPAIASEIPNYHGKFLLLDAGASPDIDPEHLVEFALMGRVYAEKVMGKSDPRVHLLNIGEEEGKGNKFSKEAFRLLSEHSWFAGNIEGKDMFHQPCEVVVCDAFVGNVVLKTSEGVAELILRILKEALPKNPVAKLAYVPLRTLVAPLRKRMDYAETGGSPLLGLNGNCVIGHGRSNARAIENALYQAQTAIETGLLEAISAQVVRVEEATHV